MKNLSLVLLCFFVNSIVFAQLSLTEGLTGYVELQGSVSDGKTPLWLNANKYGLSSLEDNNGYVRLALERDLKHDNAERWGMGYGADLVLPYNYSSHYFVQQLYWAGRYKHGVLTVGQKQQKLNLKPQDLSSGSQTLGINARPVPGVRLEMPDYWMVPGTRQWLGFRGHLDYGVCTDGGWQRDWGENIRRTENVLLHTKSGFLRIGKDEKPFSVEMGLEMTTQFGGRIYNTDGSIRFEKDHGIKEFFKAFVGGKNDMESGDNNSAEGNMMGSWLLRLNYQLPSFYIGLYADHYFDDDSQMFLVDYDGYGSGSEWNVMKDRRFYLYPLKDYMVGMELKVTDPSCSPLSSYLNHFVVEYITTRYQSGPIYHDHTPNISDHLGGWDDYLNHFIYLSYSHWGQVMGNPLYLSPIYNEGKTMNVKDNRFWAWHFGFSGDPASNLHYRLLASWQRGWGTYNDPYDHPRRNFSLMGELSWKASDRLSLVAAFGLDRGGLLGDNSGGQLTLRYNFLNK